MTQNELASLVNLAFTSGKGCLNLSFTDGLVNSYVLNGFASQPLAELVKEISGVARQSVHSSKYDVIS